MVPRLSPVASARLPRFAPAQNAGGVPVTTIAPTVSSASNASIAAMISATIGAVSVLRSSGLLSVSVPTPSAMSVRTRGWAGEVADGVVSEAIATVWQAGIRPGQSGLARPGAGQSGPGGR